MHLEHKESSLFLDKPENARPFLRATDTLREVALEPARSAKFIAAVADEYEW